MRGPYAGPTVKPPRRIAERMSTQERVAILGGGRMGTALEAGMARAKRPARIAPRDAEGQRALVAASGIVVLAVPFEARRAIVDALGSALDGKIVVDVTNPLTFPGPVFAWEGSGSGAEELQAWIPRARVVKAFNTVFSNAMTDGRVGDAQTSTFVAGDDATARASVLALARAMGFDAVDAGPLSNARSLEQLTFFEMMLEKVHGSRIGWRLLRA